MELNSFLCFIALFCYPQWTVNSVRRVCTRHLHLFQSANPNSLGRSRLSEQADTNDKNAIKSAISMRCMELRKLIRTKTRQIITVLLLSSRMLMES